jgi:diguanylate cyclase (GGDEF)-like protein/PAS domain S-box-containing protein
VLVRARRLNFLDRGLCEAMELGRGRGDEGESTEQLLQAGSLYRTLAANLPDTSMFLFDHDLRVLVAEGDAVRRLPWIDASMFRGRLVGDLQGELPDEVLALSRESYRAALDGERRDFEFTSGGLTFEVTAVPVHGHDGEVQSALAVVRDVTERRRADVDRARLAAVVAGSDDAILAKDLTGLITDWNAAAERLYGYSSEQAIGRPVAMLVPPERRDEDLMLFKRVLNGERVAHFDTERVRRDGSRVAVSLSISPIRDSTQAITGASTIARDVSQRRAADADRAQLAALASHSPDAIVAVDESFHITAYNPAAAEMFQLTREAMLGRHVTELTQAREDDEERLDTLRQALAGHTARSEQLQIRVDGSMIALATTSAPIRAGGAIVGVVTTIRDVTAQRQARLALEREERRAGLLARASVALGSSLQAAHAVSAMAQLVVPELGDVCVVIAAGDEFSPRLTSVGAVDPSVEDVLLRALEDVPLSDVARKVSDPALAAGENVLLDPITPGQVDSWAAQFPALRDELAALAVCSGMIVPLRSGARTVGLAFVGSLQPEWHFTRNDLSLIREVADRVSRALENARLFASAQRAQAQAEAAARHLVVAEQRFRSAFVNAPIGMALLSTHPGEGSQIDDVNPALCKLTGFALDELQGSDLIETLVHPSERDPARRDVQWLLDGELSAAIAERHYIHSNGGDIWVQTSVWRLTDASDDNQIVLQVQDITERKRFEQELRHLADHDPLTGLVNRRRFTEDLDREVANGRRDSVATAVLVADVDHLKDFNDTYGHAAGDEVLAAVSRLLSERTRETDTVGRLSGDEFGVVLARSGERAAQAVADSLLEDMRQFEFPATDPQPVIVTLSIGLRAIEPDESLTADELIVEADIAMYEAKENGHDRVALGGRGSEAPARLRKRLTIADRIRHALQHDEGFKLYEQPILSLHSDAIERTEILVRMSDENGEILLPAAFLPIADRFGLVPGLDQWVVTHSIDLLERRQAAGIDLGLEVNLSGTSIGDRDVVDFITASVRNARIDPRALTFEVTETEAIVNIDRARLLSQQLSGLGCQFALDDFGSGFGSFYYLKHLPFDVVKIDGDFIKALKTSKTDQLTIEAIVTITRGLEKQTIAECVEDQDTIELLRGFGVDFAQGFHIGRPEPVILRPDYAKPSSN